MKQKYIFFAVRKTLTLFLSVYTLFCLAPDLYYIWLKQNADFASAMKIIVCISPVLYYISLKQNADFASEVQNKTSFLLFSFVFLSACITFGT